MSNASNLDVPSTTLTDPVASDMSDQVFDAEAWWMEYQARRKREMKASKTGLGPMMPGVAVHVPNEN